MISLMRVLVACVVLAGCTYDDWINKIASPAEQAAARGYLDQLKARQFEDIERDLDPSLRTPGIRALLEQMAAAIPPGPPAGVKVIGANKVDSSDGLFLNLTFEYDYRDRWVLANVATRQKGAQRAIVGLNVNPMAQSLEAANRFTFAGKGALHYAVLACALAALGVSLWALVACIRTPLARRKWAWLLFIALGIGQVALDWTTGQWSVNPNYFQLLSAGISATPYGPWFVTVSLPLGAMVFLARRRRLALEQPPAPSEPATTDT